MIKTSPLNTPVLWINKYIQAKVASELGIAVPMFTPGPNTINQFTEQFLQIEGISYPYAGASMTWDRLRRMRRGAFPHIKCEQILYYLIATEETAIETVIRASEAVFRLLDREDESAEEVNNWCSNRRVNMGTGTVPDPIDNVFYFHRFKVYQLEETRDIIDFGTARTYGGNKLIVDYDYHQMPGLTNNEWQPEAKPATKIVV